MKPHAWMARGVSHLVAVMMLLAFATGVAHAQTSSISGVVTDSAGGVVPGATVSIVNDATKETHEGVTNSQGQFSFPALPIGTYTVTISLAGFKTSITNNVRLLTGTTGTVNATLEVGALTEKVEVKSRNELVQTQAATVQTTLTGEQIREIPLPSRNALYAVTLLPGIQYGSGGGPRASGINGLPNNTINITIDGVQTGNMLQSTDGFFSMVTPRMDAVEEITVTGAVAGAGSGTGSVQIQFTTRSGSNQFEGSAYHYWRQPEFNSNYFFNKVNALPRNQVIVHQYGFRQGGPIVIPGLYNGRNKGFFFFNFEHLHQPSSVTRTREFLTEQAASGIFGYNVAGAGRREVNLLALAAANGQIATIDPLIQSILSNIRQSTTTTGTINDTGLANRRQYVWQSESKGDQYSPTTRVDFNLSDNHRLSGAYWWQRFKSNPDLLNSRDPIFPGQLNLGTQNSYRTTGNSTLRSTLGRNLVNEVKGGWQWSPNEFFSNITAEQFTDQNGLGISFPANTGNGLTHTISPAPRNTTTWQVDNTLNWLRGAHSLSIGGGYAGVFNRQNEYTVVPNIVLGFDTNLDPARGMFTNGATGTFPGATNDQLTEARNIYALLTGRVLSINGTARLDSATGKYVYNGDLARKSRQSMFNAFIQDQWRVKPTLTINAGLRWDLYMPFTPADNTWSLATIEDICGVSGLGNGIGGRTCNIFNPNATGGQLVPTFDLFEQGTASHRTNWTDFAPNVGVAWRPDVQDGWMKTLLGDPEQATIRAGYSLTYNQERIDRFANNSGANAGGVISATRNNTTGYPLVLPGESHPVLVSQTSRLGPPVFPETPVYPMNAQIGDSVNIFPQDRNLRTPRVHSYSAGIQRSIGRDMAVEVRYVGNKNMHRWAEENWNERNIIENGFLDEFRAAQRNLQINAANGVSSFAFRGLPGQSPLPIHLAYLNGSRDVNNPAAYTNSNFTSSTFYNRFSPLNPNPTGAIQALDTTAFRANAITAGLQDNFMVMNPRALGGTFVLADDDWTRYNSLQVELRRRLSRGLLVSANYTYGVKETSVLTTLRYPRIEVDASDDRMAPHVFKANWHYEIPVGHGKRYGNDFNAVLNGILGGWEFSGNAQLKRDRYRLANVVLEGMTVSELQKEFKIRQEVNASGRTVVFSFPEDIRLNTWAAFSVDPTTATGYSAARGVPTGRYIRPAGTVGDCMYIYRNDCGVDDINLNGPLWSRWDMRLKKRFPIHGRVNVEVMAEVLNVFDNINFNHSVNANPNNGEDTFRVTSAYTDINTTFDPGGRIGQLVWRINW